MKTKIRYNLFRTKISFPLQGELFLPKDETSQSVFEKCLKEQTSIKYRENHVWKSGNIHEINEDGGYFAFGKVSLSDLEVFDNDVQDFRKAIYTAGLHSIIVFSKKYELFAIQVNHKLGLTEKTAEKLQSVLRKVRIVSENNLLLTISKISDPKDFVSKIREAYAVKQLQATFTRPNPFDADEKFQKPSSALLLAVNGDEGKTIFKGKNLDMDVVESISRSSVATGNVAKARILKKPNSHLTTISTRGDPYSLSYNAKFVDPETVYKDMICVYEEIRDGKNVKHDRS